MLDEVNVNATNFADTFISLDMAPGNKQWKHRHVIINVKKHRARKECLKQLA